MNELVLIAIPVSFIIINGPLLKNMLFKKNQSYNKKMRSDICLGEKPDYCPMSSYKQCTNNYLPASPCLCEERSYELCPLHKRINQKAYQRVYDPFKKPFIPPHIPGKPRVNMYQSDITAFDKY